MANNNLSEATHEGVAVNQAQQRRVQLFQTHGQLRGCNSVRLSRCATERCPWYFTAMSYDIYDVRAESLADARQRIEEALRIGFTECDSYYHGGTYYRAGDVEKFMLKLNLDPIEPGLCELEFPDARFLLYVDESRRPEQLRVMLEANRIAKRIRTDSLE